MLALARCYCRSWKPATKHTHFSHFTDHTLCLLCNSDQKPKKKPLKRANTKYGYKKNGRNMMTNDIIWAESERCYSWFQNSDARKGQNHKNLLLWNAIVAYLGSWVWQEPAAQELFGFVSSYTCPFWAVKRFRPHGPRLKRANPTHSLLALAPLAKTHLLTFYSTESCQWNNHSWCNERHRRRK